MKPTNAGMNPWTRVLLVAAGIIGGCAAMSDPECRSADWYQVGYRDALYGLQPQDGAYAHQCERSGAKVDRARYGQGWREGKWEFDSRMRKD